MRDAKEYRRTRDLLKAQLNSARIGSPDDYLNDSPQPLPARTKTPAGLEQYENFIPTAARKAALRANHEFRRLHRRKHRKTGRHKGPQIDDAHLAQHCYRLMQEYLLTRAEAAREMATALNATEGISIKSARARIRRAMRTLVEGFFCAGTYRRR